MLFDGPFHRTSLQGNGIVKSGIFDIQFDATISPEGVRRLRKGHLWIYEGHVVDAPAEPAPLVRVRDTARNLLGFAFYSPHSRIRLRLLGRETQPPSPDLIRDRIHRSIERRRSRLSPASACRLVYGEADLIPSVLVDRYRDCLVLQTLSSGADALKELLVEILRDLLDPVCIVERNDVKARRLEGLEERRGVLWGTPPDSIQIHEGGIRFLVDPLHGQKTGFFLDQCENRIAARGYAFGQALDCFTHTGAFALHFALQCESVVGVDISPDALAWAERNRELNSFQNVAFEEANVFDYLRDRERAGGKFHTICLDPPAFAKNRASLPAARAGYKEINLRALKLLEPGGILVTSSCSYHLGPGEFLQLLHQASQDAHRHTQILEQRSQSADHPVLIGMPETHYLKCFILRAL
jgi:23S rRNA (cytosine1962-C5)-methyltransferase